MIQETDDSVDYDGLSARLREGDAEMEVAVISGEAGHWRLGHGDGTSYKNHFDFHSYSSGKRVKDHKYGFLINFFSNLKVIFE